MNIGTDSLTFRAIALGGLVLLMLVPVGMVSNLDAKRRDRYQEVVREVGAEWGGQQTITGPVLLVPFTKHWTSESLVGENGSVKKITQKEKRDDVFVVLPESLNVQATMESNGVFAGFTVRSGRIRATRTSSNVFSVKCL